MRGPRNLREKEEERKTNKWEKKKKGTDKEKKTRLKSWIKKIEEKEDKLEATE